MVNNRPLLFFAKGCGACVAQEQILQSFGNLKVVKIDVDHFPKLSKFVKVTPTWAFPKGNESYVLHEGLIDKNILLKRGSKFGNEILNSLAVYGKNFPDNKGFDIPNSFYNNVEKVWGKGTNTLDAGIGGTRSLGPDNIKDMYSNNYFNNIRMAHPSDQLGTALFLNRTCNTESNKSTTSKSTGLIFDSKNPQIVDNTTSFGNRSRKKNSFGNLYRQMGPAFEIGNQYLINKDTGKQLYSGAQQNESPRPYSVKTNDYIGRVIPYKPKLN
jgi:hypothetical protein